MNCGDQSSGCLSHAESASCLRQLGVYVFGSAVTVTQDGANWWKRFDDCSNGLFVIVLPLISTTTLV